MAAPWDKVPGETDESYTRFLLYRNIGPTRSLRRAYFLYLREYDGFRGVMKGVRPPGSWQEECRDNFWPERAAAWDVRNLTAYGSKVAALHAEAVAVVARKNLRYAGAMKPGDDGWLDLMASMKVVAAFLSPELVRGIERRNQSARKPPATAGAGRADVE